MRLLYLTVGWIFGIVCAAAFPKLVPLFWLIALGITVQLAFTGYHSRWRWLLLTIAACAAGGWRYTLVPQTSPLAQYHDVGNATIVGIVVEEPDRRDDRILLQVASETIEIGTDPIPISGQILIEAAPHLPIRYGDRIRATGPINQPETYDTFSYADYLARQNVFTIMRRSTSTILSSGHGFPLRAALIHIRSSLTQQINSHLPEPQAGLLAGILLGDDSNISPETEDAFSRTGTAHIIAISGFNMVVVAGIMMAVLRRLLGERWLTGIAGIALLAIYTILVGTSGAVLRAAMMTSLMIVAGAMKRSPYLPASVAFTMIVLSAENPVILWDIGFQLSIAAVMGIATFTNWIGKQYDSLFAFLLPDNHLAAGIAKFFRDPLVVTIAASITTTPLIILYFQRLSLITLVANLLVIPVQPTVVFIGGAATISFLIIPALGQLLYWIALIPLSWTLAVVRSAARFPYADTSVTIPVQLVVAFYIIIFGGIMIAARPYWLDRYVIWIRRRSILLATVFASSSILILLLSLLLSRPDGKLHVWWLDAGHSNAILLQTPGGAQILVDGGRFPSRLLTGIGDRIPFYDRHLEIVVISQPDEYDFSALSTVLTRYDAGAVLINGHPTLSEAYQTLEQILARFPIIPVQSGYTIELDDGVKITILNPQVQPELEDPLNDHAIVLRIEYGQAVLLLPGDLSRQAQNLLVDNQVYLQAAVLQIPQHGTIAGLSSRFLQTVQPQLAIIQADPANRLNDPSLDTLALLEDIPVMRTDESGALHLWTDGSALWIQSDR